MAADAYLLSGGAGGDRSKFQTLWSAHKSRSQGGGNDRRAEAYGARSNTTRVGIAYGSIAARSGTTPGRGEVKFYRVNTDNHTLGDLDELPTTVYNLGTSAIADGDYLIAHLDLSGKFVDEGRTIGQAVWITGEGAGGGPSGYAQLITSDAVETQANSVTFDEWEQGESGSAAALFEFTDDDDTADNRKQGIKVLQDGTYLIGWNAVMEITTSSGASLTISGTPGQNLCDDIVIEQVGLTASLNDDTVTPQNPARDTVGDGTHPGHAEVTLTAWKICGKSVHGHGNHCSPATLQADDTIRLWSRPITVTAGRCVLTADLWVKYIGPVDFTDTGTA